jgi:hypothetical protein
MPDLISFSRNRCVSVEQPDSQTMRSSCRLQDTLIDASVEITVGLPDLEITQVACKVRRTYLEQCRDPGDCLQKVIGTRVGPGMLKIIKGLLAEATGCRQLVFMVEECCHGIILSFTKDMLKLVPPGQELAVDFFKKWVSENIRLYNRCAAFAPGSSIVEGIEPP